MNILFALSASALLLLHQFSFTELPSEFHHSDSTQTLQSNSTGEIEESIRIAYSAVEGKIIKAEKKYAKEKSFWEVVVITASGSEIEFQVSTDNRMILGITADEGPFDYELLPGENLIRFSDARSKAESASGSKVLKWRFVEGKSGMQYHFWMFTKGGAAQFKLDAVTGERITKKSAKKK
jgi:hypothetical protein